MFDFGAVAGGDDPHKDNPMGDETVPIHAEGPIYGGANKPASFLAVYEESLAGRPVSAFAGVAITPDTSYSRHILDCGYVDVPAEHQGGTIRSQDHSLPPGFNPYTDCIPGVK